MGERKVLNRYFPPDFDPLLVPKRKYDPYKQVEVRMMIPFSLQCIKCGEYMYRGKKFNSRKEDVIGDDYLGIKKYRFYIKCCVCNNEIAFKTDPKNQDYVCESGLFSASPPFFSLPCVLVFATCAAVALRRGDGLARRGGGLVSRRWRAVWPLCLACCSSSRLCAAADATRMHAAAAALRGHRLDGDLTRPLVARRGASRVAAPRRSS